MELLLGLLIFGLIFGLLIRKKEIVSPIPFNQDAGVY
jgi:hypothetical protein